ncbi:MAG: hypothetical protein ACTSRP_02030 [Candidatus Helarchaeota archaeon]
MFSEAYEELRKYLLRNIPELKGCYIQTMWEIKKEQDYPMVLIRNIYVSKIISGPNFHSTLQLTVVSKHSLNEALEVFSELYNLLDNSKFSTDNFIWRISYDGHSEGEILEGDLYYIQSSWRVILSAIPE